MRNILFLLFLINFLFAVEIKHKTKIVDMSIVQQNRNKIISLEEALKKILNSKNAQLKEQEVENNISLPTNENQFNSNENNFTKYKPFKFVSYKKLIENIQSKRQVEIKEPLKRFGEKFFYNKNTLNASILAVPDYYQVNIGDVIKIQIFGREDKTLELQIDNNGNIYLPVFGPIYVVGLSVSEIKDLITKTLGPTYPNSKIVVNVEVNSFIQVNLTGYVPAPGVYNLTSLSTIKDLLIVAKGFGNIGSMREVYLLRGGKLLKIIDFYKLIKDGKLVDTTLLRNGDIIYVPRAKNLVTLRGDVYTKAIYELKDEERLKDLINFSGGMKPSASSSSIKIKRYINNNYTKVYIKNLEDNFALKNGDDVYVYKISELNQDYVTVYGNIERPGYYEIPRDKKLSSLLKKLSFLKNTFFKYGVIKHFDDTITIFSLKNPKNITLKRKDEIYIFNKYEVKPVEFIQIKGNVKKSGKYRFYKGMTIKSAILAAGTNKNTNLKKVQLIRYTKDFRPTLKYIDVTKNPNFKLKPFDEIKLFNNYNFNPLKPITIKGAVNAPNVYVYSKNMTLKDALLLANWFEDKADKNYIELIRYEVINGERIRKIKKLTIKDLNFTIKPYDEIYVKTIPNWYEKKVVTIKGEVKYPGVYVIEKGEKLSSVIKRAGGFTKNAYLYGAVFTRESVKKMQEKRIKEMVYKLKKKVAIISASARSAGEASLDAKNLIESIDEVAKQAEKLKPIGRVALILDKNLAKFEASPYNIVLENNDTLYIPPKKDSIVVLGEVLTPTSFVYTSNKALDYIKLAGGVTELADEVYFVVHANGFTKKGSINGWFGNSIKVKPGDAIVIPIKIKTSTWYSVTKDMTSILYQLAITAASLKTVGAL